MNNLEVIAENYEAMHDDWKDLEKIVRRKEFNNLIEFCSESHQRVIEFGLGDGVFTSMLCEKFDSVTAVDAAQTTIDILSKELKFDNITFEQSYIEDYCSEIKYDVIVMSHILEHLTDPILALEKVSHLMHEETIIYISVPNANSLHRLVAVKMGLLKRTDSLNQRDLDLGHKIVFSPQSFKATVEKSGLKIYHFGGVMIKPLTNSQIVNDWSLDIINGFIALGDDLPDFCGDIYVLAKKNNEK
ncbi:class I SAM-dependent methyltransferase [Vibrio scophthalmi]|uniref:3-demethylubiquinol 3-O-methyltransferase n=1 Tax=Vibrio scophthalmi TaxID=45658 RepID=A0A1C7FFF3_9VIBR|nr:class I SAM-dependent methyltransferase [Vibrio scophthalmi]ANU37739.1 hypothetical protein VSVS05_02661 [Vibrio scophthalmi]